MRGKENHVIFVLSGKLDKMDFCFEEYVTSIIDETENSQRGRSLCAANRIGADHNIGCLTFQTISPDMLVHNVPLLRFIRYGKCVKSERTPTHF